MFDLFAKIFKRDSGFESMDAALGVKGGEVLTKPCDTCRWWDSKNPTVCDAFPKGVPLPIILGYLDHTVPFEDEDLHYEPSLSNRILKIKKDTENYKPLDSKVSSSGGGSFEELHPRYPKGGPKAGKFMPKGSPEYIAARKASLDRFSAAKFAVGRSSGANEADYSKKSNIQKLREGYMMAKKILTPDTFAEFQKISAELAQDRIDGKETYKKVSTTNPETKERTYTSERLKLHNEILDKLFKNAKDFKPKDGAKPEFIILGGTGGAGKSGFEKGPAKVFDKTTHLKLDNDEIKGLLPEYNPQKAYLSHVEAGDILDKALARAKVMGLNTVLDSTMRSSAATEINSFKDAGYTIQAHYMHISPVESAGRALLRWVGNQKDDKGNPIRGRLVPPDVILGMVDNLKNFDEAKGLADKWSFNRNNVPKGSAPIKVISSHDF